MAFYRGHSSVKQSVTITSLIEQSRFSTINAPIAHSHFAFPVKCKANTRTRLTGESANQTQMEQLHSKETHDNKMQVGHLHRADVSCYIV